MMTNPTCRSHHPLLFCLCLLATSTGCDKGETQAETVTTAGSSHKATGAAASSSAAVAAVKRPGDPLLAAVVGDSAGNDQLVEDASISSLGLAWRIPEKWKTISSWSAEETKSKLRKKVQSKTGHQAMAVSVLTDEQMKRFAGGKAFPKAGEQPYGGTLAQGKWTPFTEVTFGRSKLEAIATHGVMRGTRYLYVMFRAPKGDSAVQVKLSWQDGKTADGELVCAVARSVGVE